MNTAEDLREKLIDYIQDAHAMEQNVLRMLDSMIATTKDNETVARLQQHRRESERHEQLMRGRLEALGKSPSMTAEATAIGGAMLKGVGDQMRTDKPGKNARDGYITEHTEIAAYERWSSWPSAPATPRRPRPRGRFAGTRRRWAAGSPRGGTSSST